MTLGMDPRAAESEREESQRKEREGEGRKRRTDGSDHSVDLHRVETIEGEDGDTATGGGTRKVGRVEEGERLNTGGLLAVVLNLRLRNFDVEGSGDGNGELVRDVVPPEDVALLDDAVVAATQLEDGGGDDVLVLDRGERVPEELGVVVVLVEALGTKATTGALNLVRREGKDVRVGLGKLSDRSLILDEVLLVLAVGAADGRSLEAVRRVVGTGGDAVLVLTVAD
jgi:hypothetical protein